MQARAFSALLFFNAFSTGIILPVFSLIFVSKGARLDQLAILMGILSFTVILLELPTGILADLFGKRRIFLISLAFSCVSVALLLSAGSFVWLAAGVCAAGVSRALSSGSVEALYIDWHLDHHGEASMATVLTRLNILEPAGLSAGAALGGFLPGISSGISFLPTIYDGNLVARLLIILLVGLLTIILIEEKKPEHHTATALSSLTAHLKTGFQLIREQNVLRLLFLSIFSVGFVLFAMETYWQPRFVTLLTDQRYLWLLGLLSFSCFAAATLGSLASKRLLDSLKIKSERLYPISRLFMAAALLMLAFQLSLPGYIIVFPLVYFFLGLSNVPESVLLNNAVTSRHRASILSLNSLVFQFGGLTASVISAFIILKLSIPRLWIVSAVVVLITSLIFLGFAKSKAG